MDHISIEIKARCPDLARIRKILKSRQADFKGLDHQTDTYFKASHGRLKLREGNIENALIYYKRADQKNSKRCDSIVRKLSEGRFSGREPSLTHKGQALSACLSPVRSLKQILSAALGVLAVVDKKREIYFIRNAKFHLDQVKRLGKFLEIEVFGSKKKAAQLKAQCEFYQKLLGIKKRDLVADSYSDQLLRL